MGKIKLNVFLPPFLLLISCVIYNFFQNKHFTEIMTSLYNFILDKFGWLFISSTVFMLFVCVWLCFTPFGDIIIGGSKAKPIYRKFSWYTITLCTTVAAGIIFWGAAEPVQHMLYPPSSSGIIPMSPESAIFAMSTVYVHWTILPYSIYTIITIMFAFSFYNMKRPFSIGSALMPIIPEKHMKYTSSIVDIICIFSLVAGLSASLGIGVLNINGGLGRLYGIGSNRMTWAIILSVIVITFMFSAISGIKKGIKFLSNINVYVYLVILLIVLLFGGTVFIFSFGIESIGEFMTNFFKKALFTGAAASDNWAKEWPMFYFGNWMAWAPITAVFLGRISYGRKVKEVVYVNLFATSVFSILWFMIISGATVNQVLNNSGSGIVEAFQLGYEYVTYRLFDNLPFASITIPLFLFSIFISLVTAADSTIVAISSLCCTGLNPKEPDSPGYIKFLWGIIIAVVTWIMMSIGEGITGIKMLSNIGGLPSMFLIIGITFSCIYVALNHEKYNHVENSSFFKFNN